MVDADIWGGRTGPWSLRPNCCAKRFPLSEDESVLSDCRSEGCESARPRRAGNGRLMVGEAVAHRVGRTTVGSAGGPRIIHLAVVLRRAPSARSSAPSCCCWRDGAASRLGEMSGTGLALPPQRHEVAEGMGRAEENAILTYTG